MSRIKRLVSYGVLGIACLASVATSVPAGISRQTDGQIAANGESPVIDGSLGISRNPVSTESLMLSFTVKGRGLGGVATTPLEGRFAAGEAELGPWLATPIFAQVSSSLACGASSYCEIPFHFQLRTVSGGSGSSVLIPWHIDVFVEGDVSTAELQISTENSGPSATSVAFVSSLFGILAGLAAVFLVMRFANVGRRRALAAIAFVTGAAALAVLGEGVVLEGLPQKVAIATLIIFIPLPLALVGGTKMRAQGEVLGVALIAAPLLLGLVNDQGVFRAVDVAVLFLVIGALLPIGAALLWITRERRASVGVEWPRKWLAVLILAALLASFIWVWSLAVAGGATNYALWYIGIPMVAVMLLAWGAWRWFDNSSAGTLIATGILLPIAAVLGFLASGLPYMFSENRAPAAVIPSLVAIGVGGLVLAVLAAVTPDRPTDVA